MTRRFFPVDKCTVRDYIRQLPPVTLSVPKQSVIPDVLPGNAVCLGVSPNALSSSAVHALPALPVSRAADVLVR